MTRRAVPNGPIAHAVAITVVLARIHLRTDTDEVKGNGHGVGKHACAQLEGKVKFRYGSSESKDHENC